MCRHPIPAVACREQLLAPQCLACKGPLREALWCLEPGTVGLRMPEVLKEGRLTCALVYSFYSVCHLEQAR